MVKFIFYLSLVIIPLIFSCKTSFASNNSCNQTAGYSACSDYRIKEIIPDIRKLKLQNYLKNKNSDLHRYSNYLIEAAEYHQLPWTLLPAIAGVESNFCKNSPSLSYNCWGWANGKYRFKNYYEAIDKISSGIKTKYINRGLTTPERIGKVYAPPSASWAANVRFFMNKIENASFQNPAGLQISY